MSIVKKSLLFFITILLFTSTLVFADDNATSGDGGTSNAKNDKGFYRGSEYMYKVSVYIGLSDQAGKNGELDSDFMMIGNSPVYIKPEHFSLQSNISYAVYSKINYQNGAPLVSNNNRIVITDNPPPIPITNGGNIGSVKSYFGDTKTLIGLIDAFAIQKGTSREGSVSNIHFTINGEKKKLPPEEVLPIKTDGIYQNKVPWVIVYEPVIISYLKDKTTSLAFTASEYALAQKLGYFNFKAGSDGQYISGMTHSDLPNSIVLEESWFGYPVISALPDNVKWSEDRIIQGGGWGMRMLKANTSNDTMYDYNYRVDTDVITSVRVYAKGDRITPDNKAYIAFNINGKTTSKSITIPEGSSQLVFIKWPTPTSPQMVNISVEISGNAAAKFDNNARSASFTAKVEDLNKNIPPNPTANDKKPYDYSILSVPEKTQKETATWGEWECEWVESNGGHGGDWKYTWNSYTASLSASMTIKPDAKVPTATSTTMKSGYGINQKVSVNLNSNAPNSNITPAQTSIAYYPEFNYIGYCRVMDLIKSGYSASFELKENKYSTYNSRVHFTPVWFPNGTYQAYAEVIDVWTPAGMLSCSLTDSINIQGSLYDDWHIGPRN